MAKRQSGIAKQGLIMVGVPLLLQLVFVSMIELLIVQAKADIQTEYKASLLIDDGIVFSQRVLSGTIICAMIYMATSDKRLIKSFEKTREVANEELAALRTSSKLLPEQWQSFLRIEKCYKKITQDWEQLIQARLKLDKEAERTHTPKAQIKDTEDGVEITPVKKISVKSTKMFNEIKQLYDDLNDELDKFIATSREKVNLNPITRKTAHKRVELLLFMSICSGIIASIVIAAQFSASITGRIKILIENTFRFRDEKELLPQVSGNDEIADYDRAFHRMASAISTAKEYKAQLLSVVSHEVRTPLTSVQASLSNILGGVYGELETASHEDLESAEREVMRIIGMVNNLIDLERMKSGRFPINLTPIDLSGVLEEVVLQLKDEGLKLPVNITAPESIITSGDGKLLKRLLIGLIAKASDCAPDHSSLTITISEDGTYARLIVDSASSLSEEEEEEEEKTSKDAAKVQIADTDIELALCQAIAEIHDGKLETQSTESKRGRLCLQLPLSKS